MKLGDLVTQYVTFRKSLGERCYNEHVLRFFCRKLGANRDVRTIRVAAVCRFLAGSGPITRNWHRKYTALRSFYRYALTRGHVTSVPLPITIPKEPASLTPYIYSREEYGDYWTRRPLTMVSKLRLSRSRFARSFSSFTELVCVPAKFCV